MPHGGPLLAWPSLAASAAEPATVFAAASLAESLEAVGAAWAARGHAEPVFVFDATSRLASQLEAGAPADLFVSADRAWMDTLAGSGRIDPGTRVDLLGNTLVVVVPAGSALAVTGAADLAQPAVKHLALAGEAVPAGRYARSALAALGGWEPVKDRVVSGDSVRTALAWVAAGEAEAGFVYATDARVEPRVRVAWSVPAGAHPPIGYPAAVVAGAAHAAEAKDFLSFCRGPEATAVFRAAGFAVP